MIHGIGSSIPSFRALEFHRGLNVLLADQDSTSTAQDSRNSLGKSSVVEIVHFLLGGRADGDSVFKASALRRASFWGEFTFGGTRLRVERRTWDREKVFVTFRSPPRVPLRPDGDLFDPHVNVKDWTAWLGTVCFALPTEAEGVAHDRGGPTFRSLFGYFARRRVDNGFSVPWKFATGIPDAEGHLALSYLFGLDWSIARDFERRKQDRKDLQAETRLAVARDPKLATLAAATAELVVAEQRAERVRDELNGFRVEEQYEELVQEAATAKRAAERLTKKAIEVRNFVDHIEASLEGETAPSIEVVERLYGEVGIQLPDSVRKGFDEVRAFHEAVLSNRRVHLAMELERGRNQLAGLESERRANTSRRTEILGQLSGKGAFGDLAGIQRRLAEAEQRVSQIRALKDTLQRLETDKASQRIERIGLKQRLEQDLETRLPAVRAAVLAVDEALIALYGPERPKSLQIMATEAGPRFVVSVAGDRSGGISNMEIFAMDYALFKVTADTVGGPGFLIHDSHLFDGVDSRQAAAAIETAGRFAVESDRQYVVMMNSDKFAGLEFSPGFDVASSVLPVVLRDTPDGGLFGFRFE